MEQRVARNAPPRAVRRVSVYSLALSRLAVAMVRQLLNVVNQTVERPLHAYLALSAQREAVQPFIVPQVLEHGLYRCDAPTVERTSAFGVDRLAHAFCVTQR